MLQKQGFFSTLFLYRTQVSKYVIGCDAKFVKAAFFIPIFD